VSIAKDCRFRELFEDDKERLSSNRVTVLFGVLIGAIVIIGLTVLLYIITSRGINIQTEYTAQANTAALTQILSALSVIIGLFFALCAGVYGMAKYSDNSVAKTEIKAANPQQPAAPANVTINQPEKSNVVANS